MTCLVHYSHLGVLGVTLSLVLRSAGQPLELIPAHDPATLADLLFTRVPHG